MSAFAANKNHSRKNLHMERGLMTFRAWASPRRPFSLFYPTNLALAALIALCLFFLIPASPLFAAEASPPAQPTNAQEEAEDNETPVGEQTIAPVNQAWDNLWDNQKEMISNIRDTALQLSGNFANQTANLSGKLQPFEEEGRRLLVFANTFKGYPQPMEAIVWRISATLADLDDALEPVNRSRAEAQNLLQRVINMASTLPDMADKATLSPEMQAYVQDIVHARLRLTAVLTQYDSLAPALSMVTRLETARKDIATRLPGLWKDYYLQKPVPWLDPDIWLNLPQYIIFSWQIILMRLPVEIPTTLSQWGACILRFFLGIILGTVVTLLLRRRWVKPGSSEAIAHIFKTSAPWLVLGSAFLGSGMAATGDFFRVFLAIGSACIIIGEIFLSWDLRRIQYPGAPAKASPFFRLLPLALCAYVLLYLPIPQVVALVIWTFILSVCLYFHKRWKKFAVPKMQLEDAFMECFPLILWPCLFLAVSGLQIYSMLLYLAFVALAVAFQLSLGGMSIVSSINEHLPQEGASAVLARLGVALAAPFVLVLAVAGVCLWVLILPGGAYLLGEYALKGVTVGATQFNIIQILLIISAFYLTRTIVAMGTRFLTKLPKQGGQFDATLITPMQTTFTYVTWAVFGLFVLHSLGMQLSSLAMVAGGLSVGIGFGMQTIVNNFLSGLILIFGRTLQVGDIVEVGGTTGKVRKISVRATMVETYDNAIIYVPNSEFMANRLTNWTSFTRSVRCQIQVGIAYGSDTAKAIELLINIAKAHENVLKYPAPSVNFADFAASSLDFRLRFWVRDYDLGPGTASQLRLSINNVFNENGIEIAFPQLDVHLKDQQQETPPAPARTAPKRPRAIVKPSPRPGVKSSSTGA